MLEDSTQKLCELKQHITELEAQVSLLKKQLFLCQESSIMASQPIKKTIFYNQKQQSSHIKKNMFDLLEQIISQNLSHAQSDTLFFNLESILNQQLSSFLDLDELLDNPKVKDLLQLLKSSEHQENLKNMVALLTYLYNRSLKEEESSKNT